MVKCEECGEKLYKIAVILHDYEAYVDQRCSLEESVLETTCTILTRSGFNNFISAIDRPFSEAAITRILRGNGLRVFQKELYDANIRALIRATILEINSLDPCDHLASKILLKEEG